MKENDTKNYHSLHYITVKSCTKWSSESLSRIALVGICRFFGHPLWVAKQGEEDDAASSKKDRNHSDRLEVGLVRGDGDDEERDHVEEEPAKKAEESGTSSLRLAGEDEEVGPRDVDGGGLGGQLEVVVEAKLVHDRVKGGKGEDDDEVEDQGDHQDGDGRASSNSNQQGERSDVEDGVGEKKRKETKNVCNKIQLGPEKVDQHLTHRPPLPLLLLLLLEHQHLGGCLDDTEHAGANAAELGGPHTGPGGEAEDQDELKNKLEDGAAEDPGHVQAESSSLVGLAEEPDYVGLGQALGHCLLHEEDEEAVLEEVQEEEGGDQDEEALQDSPTPKQKLKAPPLLFFETLHMTN